MTKAELASVSAEIIEALDKLPDDVNIYAVTLDFGLGENRMIRAQVCKPVEWPAVFDGTVHKDWVQKIIQVTPHIQAWWGVDIEPPEDDTENNDGRSEDN